MTETVGLPRELEGYELARGCVSGISAATMGLEAVLAVVSVRHLSMETLWHLAEVESFLLQVQLAETGQGGY